MLLRGRLHGRLAALTTTKVQTSRLQMLSALPHVGNGQNTVSRVLFRRRELTEPHWVFRQTRWVLRETRWVRFGTQIIGWEELTEFSPRNSVRAKKTHWVPCLKPCSPKPYSARFRTCARGLVKAARLGSTPGINHLVCLQWLLVRKQSAHRVGPDCYVQHPDCDRRIREAP